MRSPIISMLEQRVSANLYERSHELIDLEIRKLGFLAAGEPSAYNLQNRRFIAVKAAEAIDRPKSLVVQLGRL